MTKEYEFGQVQVFHLKPDEVIVLEVQDNLTVEQAHMLRSQAQEHFGERKVIVISGGARLLRATTR